MLHPVLFRILGSYKLDASVCLWDGDENGRPTKDPNAGPGHYGGSGSPSGGNPTNGGGGNTAGTGTSTNSGAWNNPGNASLGLAAAPTYPGDVNTPPPIGETDRYFVAIRRSNLKVPVLDTVTVEPNPMVPNDLNPTNITPFHEDIALEHQKLIVGKKLGQSQILRKNP